MPGAAGIDDGGDPRADAKNIRVDAEGAEPFHEMEMDVDQARRDDAVFNVDDGGTVGFKIGADGVNLAVAHANIEGPIFTACGIK